MPAEVRPCLGRRYQLIAPIGRGGMGTVFSAHDRLSGQTVAVKCLGLAGQGADGGKGAAALGEPSLRFMIAAESEPSPRLRLALAREFHTLSSLRHPNIISVLDFGFDLKQRPYFTMQLLQSSRTLTEAAQAVPLPGKLRLLAQLLRALIYLHHRGILHRDTGEAKSVGDLSG